MEIDGPLTGIKVLEWSLWQQAPVAGVMLGDLGAEVIKIESPTGDAARGLRDAYGTESFVGGRHVQFEAWNRNKKSIALDLSKPKATRLGL